MLVQEYRSAVGFEVRASKTDGSTRHGKGERGRFKEFKFKDRFGKVGGLGLSLPGGMDERRGRELSTELKVEAQSEE